MRGDNKIPGAKCPDCDKPNDGFTAIRKGTVPTDGAVCICSSCYGVSIYEGGLLRQPTEEEWESLKNHPEIRQVVSIAKFARQLADAAFKK